MFDQKHYVPVLKGRNGEYGALQVMSPGVKARLTPILEVPPIPWNYKEEQPAKTIDAHLQRVSSKIRKSWGDERPLFVDLQWIPESEQMSDGRHPMTYVFDTARQAGLQLVPVIGLVREDHREACCEVIARDGRGVCLRLQREDFAEPGLDEQVAALLDTLGVSAVDTDLILDLRALNSAEIATLVTTVPAFIRSVPLIKRWRSFAMTATGFPENLIGLTPSAPSSIPRLEWTLWRSVIAGGRTLPRLPVFGDYAIAHPQPSEVDPRIMRPSASIRYTTSNTWLILKGRNLRDYGYEEFHEVCRQLIRRPEYSGPEFSWGDRYIQDCAHRRTGTGNLTTWRKVGTSHHLAFVTGQLATVAWT